MTSGRETKDRLYEQFAMFAQGICSSKRLELLDLLCQCEKSVDTLAAQASLSLANTSRHLQMLKVRRLVESRRAGSFVFYRLADERVCQFVRGLRHLAQARMAEIDRIISDYFGAPETLQPIDRIRLLERAEAGEIIVLDVRPKDEYAAAHLPFAKSIPLPELESRLAGFPPDAEIVAYCRGPYCVLAQEAVQRLLKEGFRAIRLEDGVVEWTEAGLPVIRPDTLSQARVQGTAGRG